MARHRSPARNWIEYLPARAAAALLQCFPTGQNLETAAWGGRLFYQLSRKRRERAISTIQGAFPEWDVDRCRRTACRSMENMFQLASVDAMVMTRLLTPDRWPEFLDFSDGAANLKRLMDDRSMLFITGHCGNWELLGYGMSVVGYPIAALARPLDNPLLNNWLMGLRQARSEDTDQMGPCPRCRRSSRTTSTSASSPIRMPETTGYSFRSSVAWHRRTSR